MKKRLKELDVYSGIAILFVIVLHSNSYYLTRVLNKNSYLEGPYFTHLLDIIVHAAVPMFIFISGYKFAINENIIDFRGFIYKKLKKVLKPFLIISMSYIIVKNILILPNIKLRNISIDIIGIFLGYNKVYHLWYIPMYIFVTSIYYMIHRVIKHKRTIFIFATVIIWKIMSVKFRLFSYYPISFIYYLLFYEIGVLSFEYKLVEKLSKKTSNLLIISHILFVLLVSFIKYKILLSYVYSFILVPFSTFIYFLISIKLKESYILTYIGKYSWYLYLLHEPIINGGISRVISYLGIYNSSIYVYIISIATIFVSMLIYRLMNRIKFNRILF